MKTILLLITFACSSAMAETSSKTLKKSIYSSATVQGLLKGIEEDRKVECPKLDELDGDMGIEIVEQTFKVEAECTTQDDYGDALALYVEISGRIGDSQEILVLSVTVPPDLEYM